MTEQRERIKGACDNCGWPTCSCMSRLTALLEDRLTLAGVVVEAESQFAAKHQDSDQLPLAKDKYLAVADRLIAYLKPLG